jgi:prevent-host-death family protein
MALMYMMRTNLGGYEVTAIIDTSALMYTAGMPGEPEVTREVKIFEARNKLAAIIDKARYFGGVTYLTNRGKPVAAIVPVEVAERYEAEQAAASKRTDAG